ncbi:hypothetical protein [Paraburkholderia sp. SIMBA_030]|uniref:hypothetical protein n=1 Tax=Paraburkholderia sp. SIMBA_030 TaxID=3085773 RepID=UPI003978AAE6
MEDTAEITRLPLLAFTELPRPDIAAGLDRYLWRRARFGFAEQLVDALDDVSAGSAGAFLYHKKSGLLFEHVEFGYHQLLLAHLCALHKMDFSREQLKWNLHKFHYADPIKKLSDEFVNEGYGLFLSTCANGKRITVGQTFPWEALEQSAFGSFERDVI